MNLKTRTSLSLQNEKLILHYGNIDKIVNNNYEYLIKALERKTMNESQLIKFIMEIEHINEPAAGFELAGFVVEFQAFLDFGKDDHKIID